MRSRRLAVLALAALWGCATHRETGEGPQRDRMTTPSSALQTGFATPQEVVVFEQDDSTLDLPRVGRRAELPHGGSLSTTIDDRVVPLPLKHTDVKAQVSLFVGSVTLTQEYHNPYPGKIEAIYVFPLPEDAGVRDFVMKIGDRRIRGIIRERAEAQRIYLDARRQGHVASLMTQQRPNIFTQAVANIEPGKRIDIQITYFHTLRQSEGVTELAIPMVIGPRYNPAGSADPIEIPRLRPNEVSGADLSLEVTIDAAGELGDLWSPSHAIRVERPEPTRAKVVLAANDRHRNRDFVLRFRATGRETRAALATHRVGDEGYFALLIQPPARLDDLPRTRREMIFVVDCSGSMQGRPLAVAKRALAKCLQRLDPDDTFQILRFSDRVAAFAPGPVAATRENVERGLRYADELATEGGTEMAAVVRAALDYPAALGRYRIVSFMTDGYIGNDREVIALAKKHVGSARIFSFGVGDTVNRYLLEGLARVGRGVSTIVLLDDAAERAVDELYRRIEHPAMTDLEIDWGGMTVTETHPSPRPDLWAGRPVVITGRFRGHGPSRVRIVGQAGGRPVEMAVPVDLDEPGLRHSALAAVWARSKITSLYDGVWGSADPQELAQEIRALALTHGILCEWTAFVAVDSMSRTAGEFGTTVVQPAAALQDGAGDRK